MLCSILRRYRVLSRWRATQSIRGFALDMVGTLQGRMMLAVLLVASPSLARLLIEGGTPATAALTGQSRVGALMIGFLVLTGCFTVMLTVILVKSLVAEIDEEPLLAHPVFLPDGAVLRVVSVILGTSIFLSAFFCVFHARLLSADSVVEWTAVGSHALATYLQFGTVGVVVARGVRRYLKGRDPRVSSRRLQRLSVVPFLTLFPLAILLPGLVHTHFPATLREIGRIAPASVFLLQAPVAIPAALGAGAWSSLALWFGGLLTSAVVSALALSRWRATVLEELSRVSDGEVPNTAVRALPFRSQAPKLVRQVWAFWAKDLLARRPGRTRFDLRYHGLLLVMAVVGLWGNVGPPSWLGVGALGLLSTSQVLLAVMALLAMGRALGSLGEEGCKVGLVRAALGVRRLFLIKALLNSGYLLAHAPIYVLVIWATARLLGMPDPSLPVLFMEAAAGGLAFGLLASALGFLLPDLKRRSLLLPGATRIAQILFATLVGLAIGARAAIGGSEALRERSPSEWAVGVALMVGLLLTAAAAVWGWAIRRTLTMEA